MKKIAILSAILLALTSFLAISSDRPSNDTSIVFVAVHEGGPTSVKKVFPLEFPTANLRRGAVLIFKHNDQDYMARFDKLGAYHVAVPARDFFKNQA